MRLNIPNDIRKLDLDRALRTAGLALDGHILPDGSANVVKLPESARRTCSRGACANPVLAYFGPLDLCAAHAVEHMHQLREAKDIGHLAEQAARSHP